MLMLVIILQIQFDFPSSTEKKSGSGVSGVSTVSTGVKSNSNLKLNCLMSPNSSGMNNMNIINSNNPIISTKNPSTVKGKLSETKLNDFRPSQILAKPQISSKPRHDTLLQSNKFKK